MFELLFLQILSLPLNLSSGTVIVVYEILSKIKTLWLNFVTGLIIAVTFMMCSFIVKSRYFHLPPFPPPAPN
jgi:hypothetical protein